MRVQGIFFSTKQAKRHPIEIPPNRLSEHHTGAPRVFGASEHGPAFFTHRFEPRMNRERRTQIMRGQHIAHRKPLFLMAGRGSPGFALAEDPDRETRADLEQLQRVVKKADECRRGGQVFWACSLATLPAP